MSQLTTTLHASNVSELPSVAQSPAVEDAALRAAVEDLGREVALEGTHPRAEVLMPSEDQLQVRLVKLDTVLRLQETNADENIAAGLFWALAGAFLGIVVNIITGDATTISKASWVAIGSTLTFLGGAGLLWYRFSLRSRDVRQQLGVSLTKG